MFKYILGLIMILVAGSVNAGLPVCTSGAFFEPERAGEGVLLTVSNELITGGLFTYDYVNGFVTNTVPVKTWYSLGPVVNDGTVNTVVLPVYETKALGPASGPLVVETREVGFAEFTFVDTQTLRFSYNIGQFLYPTCDFGPLPFWCQRRDVILKRASAVLPQCL
jgi:hypothetical protein